MIDVEGIDPEEYVQENRKRIIQIIRHSDDPFARACAWMLLDRYTPDRDLEDLRDELDDIVNRRADA